MSFWYQNTGIPGQNLTSLHPGNLKALYNRDSLTDYQVKQIGNIAKAYRNPGEYFEGKAQALKDVGDQAANIYATEYMKLINAQIPAATAHARAKSLADTYGDALRIDVEKDYPSDLSKLTLDLHYKTSKENAANGFATPSTHVPKGKKHHRR